MGYTATTSQPHQNHTVRCLVGATPHSHRTASRPHQNHTKSTAQPHRNHIAATPYYHIATTLRCGCDVVAMWLRCGNCGCGVPIRGTVHYNHITLADNSIRSGRQVFLYAVSLPRSACWQTTISISSSIIVLFLTSRDRFLPSLWWTPIHTMQDTWFWALLISTLCYLNIFENYTVIRPIWPRDASI